MKKPIKVRAVKNYLNDLTKGKIYEAFSAEHIDINAISLISDQNEIVYFYNPYISNKSDYLTTVISDLNSNIKVL